MAQLHMPVTFPAGGRTPAAAPAAPCEVRAPGHGTSWHWDHHGSPCAAQEELLVPLPSAMMSLGTATCPHPAAAVAWECPAATEPGPASRPPRLLVPEQAFAAQQVLGWALGIPGTAQDSPHCQHPAHSGAVAAPATPCHNVPAQQQQQPLPVAQLWPQRACPRLWAPRAWVGSRGWAAGGVPTALLGVSDTRLPHAAPVGAWGSIWALQWGLSAVRTLVWGALVGSQPPGGHSQHCCGCSGGSMVFDLHQTTH